MGKGPEYSEMEREHDDALLNEMRVGLGNGPWRANFKKIISEKKKLCHAGSIAINSSTDTICFYFCLGQLVFILKCLE